MGNPLQAAAEVQADRVLCALKSRVPSPALWRVSLTHRARVFFSDRVMGFLITEKELPLPLAYILCPVEVLSQYCQYTQFGVARYAKNSMGAKCLPFLDCLKSEVM